MAVNRKRWKYLFLCAFGLFAGSAFCMKWMESDFIYHGSVFTIIGLELTYDKEKVAAILGGIDEPVRNILRYHLHFDFAFMAGVYPGIAALCMMAGQRSGNNLLKKILWLLAALQIVAWACDITENMYLLKWLSDPAKIKSFEWYHFIVSVKWILALLAALIAIPLNFVRKKPV